MIFAVLILVFVVITGLVYMFSETMSQRKVRLRDRLGTINSGFATGDTIRATMDIGPGAGTAKRADMLPTVTNLLTGTDYGKKLRFEMQQAGMKFRPAEFVALCAISVAGMAIIGYAFTGAPIMGIIMGAIGYIVPMLVLKQRQTVRRQLFNKQLVDALTLIASSLRTGYSFMHSCEMVISEMPAPISEEFAWARGEASLGVPMEVALQRMVTRIKSYDLDLVATAVMIQIQVGGNLAEILDTIGKTIRERVRIKGEISALTAEGKLSGVIVFLLPLVLALFLNLRNPEYFKPLLEDPIGVPMIMITLVLQALGGLIIKKMVDIDV